MHTLLRRQLRRHDIDPDTLGPECQAFLAAVSDAYDAADDDRAMLERSLEISSRESLAINEAMRSTNAILEAILESTADGILAVHTDGRLIHRNARFAELWRIPEDLVDEQSSADRLDFVRDQITDPDAFLARVKELLASSIESLDSVAFNDGRVFERYSRPLRDTEGTTGRVWSFRDVSESRRASLALRESEERFRALVQNSSDMIIILDADGAPTYASPSVEKIMGYRLADLQHLGVLSLIHPDDLQRAARSLSEVLSTSGPHPPTLIRFACADGTWREIEMIANNMLHDPAVAGVVYNASDVTEQRIAERALSQSEARFRSLARNSSDLVTILDIEQRIVYQSPSTVRILGYPGEAIIGRTLSDVVYPDDVAAVTAFLNHLGSSTDAVVSVEARLRHEDGTWRNVDIIGANLLEDPAVAGFVLNARDVTERRALEEQMRHQAFHDPLTGLANRVLFTDRLANALERTRRTRDLVAVLFLDVDNLKSFNDAFGHQVGDDLLRGIAGRISDVLRPGDTAARVGGDEFTLLLEVLTPGDAVTVGERIISALRLPFKSAGREFFVEVSIGVAVGATDEDTVEGLLRDADAAMYVAKSRGKARVEIFDKSMHLSMHDRLQLLADMQRAIELKQFIVQYQPTFELTGGHLVGAEALVRWIHPERGIIPPLEFIPLAEEGGVIQGLGAWVLQQACAQLRHWQEQYPQDPPLHMAVNVSGHQLQPGFVDEVKRVLAETSIEPSTLVLELTESVMMRDVPATVALLNQLKALGVRLAIDDFGTGYSSLTYLRQFPFDILKIDKSFVDDVGSDTQHELTAAIVEIGRTLDLELVAEGIERADQLEHLLSLKCDIGQGYYFAKPLFAEDFEALLVQKRADAQAA